jgi:mono/diheme cytochrome c family protein
VGRVHASEIPVDAHYGRRERVTAGRYGEPNSLSGGVPGRGRDLRPGDRVRRRQRLRHRQPATSSVGAPEPASPLQPLTPAEQHGRDLFVSHCGSCHTLAAAGTIGQIGPNLGDIALNEAAIPHAIRIGGGPESHGAGGRTGNMPRNLVTGKDAKDVAAFVAANASGSETP